MFSTDNRTQRIVLALLLPFIACGVQWQFWQMFKPFVWFLFFPTIFLSSRIGGKYAGILSTAISAGLVVYFFIPPQLSFSVTNPNNYYSVLVFLFMGGLFSFTHDKLERATQHAATALEESRLANDRLTDSNRQVTLLYEKTLKLDELKTRFFSNISHELRTPLTLILGPVGRCLADSGLPVENRRDLEVVQRNALMLYRQVNDLLDMAKLEAGAMAMRYSKADLAGLVRFVASHFESLAEENNISFLIETPDTLENQVDQEKCRRILLNLLANAFKFTPSGGEIAVTLRMRNEMVSIEVRDSGPGIPEDKRETIFERFSQIDGGVERRFGGTGLGLAIVKEFVQLHGGTVAVSAAPEGGAIFTVTLPRFAPDGAVMHEAQEEGEEPFQCLAPLDTSHKRDESGSVVSPDAPLILVVEDNPDMNRYITSLLGTQYRVASAYDGEEGLAKTHSLQPDLLISDMMMPRMSGERMVRELRDQPGMDKLPIIMLSAKADDELRARLLENGVQEYLTKPFSDAELVARVGGLLAERRRTSEELRESEERLRLALDATSDALWDWDVRSGVVYRSPRYFELVGRRPDEGTPDFAFFTTTV
ncbi:MAG: response regulator, partial [Desulfuromonadales bacterium]|nr:response regulator [Desulfuromonadales bacterium]